MFVNEIKITHRRNLGNYEHREATVGMALTEEDNIEEAKKTLNNELRSILFPQAPKAPETGTATTAEEVQEAVKEEETPKEETPKEEAPKKKVTKKKVSKKVTKKKDPVVMPTKEEILGLCRDTANRLKSGDKVKELIKQCCGVESLDDADENTFLELKKKLQDA